MPSEYSHAWPKEGTVATGKIKSTAEHVLHRLSGQQSVTISGFLNLICIFMPAHELLKLINLA